MESISSVCNHFSKNFQNYKDCRRLFHSVQKETKRTYKKSASPCEPPHIEAVTHFYIPYNYFTAPFTTPFRICFWQMM